MKKICVKCKAIFDGDASLKQCPLADCDKLDLIEVDEMMADVFIRFLVRGITISNCCSGHLDKLSSDPIILFSGTYEKYLGLSFGDFRELLIKVSAGREMVTVGKMEGHGEHKVLKVTGKDLGLHAEQKERLKNQMVFLEFLYDVIDEIDARQNFGMKVKYRKIKLPPRHF